MSSLPNYRSYLFTPGDSLHKIAKAAASDADAVIIDLEDAVAPAQKAAARATTVAALQQVDFGGKGVFVRVNAIDSGLASDDLLATLGQRPVAYVLPKLETAAALQQLHTWLMQAGAAATPCVGLIESALGVLNLRQIVTATASPAGLMFGGEDYIATTGAVATVGRHELLYARSAVVNAAAAVGIAAIDTVFTDLHDLDGLRADAEAGRLLGFGGKLLIHPRQIEVVNAVWQIDAAELAAAQRLLAAYREHSGRGDGVFAFEGRMVDLAVVRRARQLVATWQRYESGAPI